MAESSVIARLEDIILLQFSPGTRVWLKSEPYGWYSAEVMGFAGFDEYRISAAGEFRERKVPSSHLVVRWNKPLGDPLKALAEGFVDSPEYYTARTGFLDQLLRQRRVSRGYSAVLSAPVELHQHQLDTVARVLSDPVLRYLLADEVGLGKTIEAGLVIRQLLLDDDSARVLVCVPATLTQQWNEELNDRLLLSKAIDTRRVCLVSHEDLARARELGDFALVVIDEAHALLPTLRGAPHIHEQLTRNSGLLLLSATPMRGNIEAFLGLLNLIDPLAFPVSDVKTFRDRVEQRESSAGSVQLLGSRRASLRQRNAALQRLGSLHQSDPVFQELAGRCGASEDSQSPVWSQLADYVRETYRISRRMIRNRRGNGAATEYPVAGRRAVFVPLEDPARQLVDDFLDRYRDELSARGDVAPSRGYPQMVLHALGGPRALLRHLESRLATGAVPSRTIAPIDQAFIKDTVAQLRLADTKSRLRLALSIVDERLRQGQKIVAVGTSVVVAREFWQAAKELWGNRVAAHLSHLDHESREENVQEFLYTAGGRLLVGDYTIEEGRNLQEADALVNLDLPLDLNRLEQRIGRLDRFARREHSPEVIIFTEPDSRWVTSHIALLAEGIGIFESSVATLQRKLSSTLSQLVGSLVVEGEHAFEMDLPALRGMLDDEQTEVDLLEELESVTVAADFDDGSIADLRSADADVDALRKAFTQLTSMRGGISLRPTENPKQGILRFETDDTRSGQERFRRVRGLDEDSSRQVLQLLDRPRTYDRAVAVRRQNIAPLRLGDPLVDWLDTFLRVDERGRTRAFLRYSNLIEIPEMWLASDFLVEFDAGRLRDEPQGVLRRLRRRGDALLPPALVRTWNDSEGPASAEYAEVLETPHNDRTDRVLRGGEWVRVLKRFPDWRELCEQAGEVAKELLASSSSVTTVPTEAGRVARQEIESRLAVLRARSLRLPSNAERAGAKQELEREEELGRVLVSGVEKPAISTVACGAVVLWPGR